MLAGFYNSLLNLATQKLFLLIAYMYIALVKDFSPIKKQLVTTYNGEFMRK